MNSSYSYRQWIIFILFAMVYGMSAVNIYLLAPFYPKEALKRGLSSFQYSTVFSSFFLVNIIVGPLCGTFMTYVDPYMVAKTGIYIIGFSNILFSFIYEINEAGEFLTLSLLIRIVESWGYSTFIVASFSIVAEEFFDDVGTVGAIFEASFGTGLTIGPSIGGVLYEYGGFFLPFFFTGVATFFIACLTFFIKNKECNVRLTISFKDLLHLIRKIECLLACLTIFSASFTSGFVDANLSSHLNSLNLSESKKSLFFVAFGFFYCISCPLWGRICDTVGSPHIVWSIGAFLTCISQILLGPAPYLNLKLNILISVISLAILGIGMASQFVSSFYCMHKVAMYLGFPDDLSTYAMVNSLFTTLLALGYMIGPPTGGFLNDIIGLPWGFHVIILLQTFLFLSTLFYSFSKEHIFGSINTVKKMDLQKLLK